MGGREEEEVVSFSVCELHDFNRSAILQSVQSSPSLDLIPDPWASDDACQINPCAYLAGRVSKAESPLGQLKIEFSPDTMRRTENQT